MPVSAGASPFRPGCEGRPQRGVNYANSEVEAWVDTNPTDPVNVVGVWEQDRWSTGGANGLVAGVSHDGGRTWQRTYPPFSRCAGGNAANGGDYDRASDPWVSFAPDETVFMAALALSPPARRAASGETAPCW